MKVVYVLFIFLSPILTDNSSLQWAQHYVELQNQTDCWICGILPMSSTSGLPWWDCPLQGTDWHSLQDYTSEIIYGDSMYQDKSITNQDTSSWPMISETWSSPGHNQNFSYSQTIKVLTDLISPQINTHQPGPKL